MAKLLSAVRLVKDYLKLYLRNKKLEQDFEGDKYVFFDLNDRRVGIYYFLLIYQFHVEDYRIIVRNRVRFIGSCRKESAQIFSLASVKIGNVPRKKQQYYYIRDKAVTHIPGNWAKEVLLNPIHEASEQIQIPFSIGPKHLIQSNYLKTPKLRSSDRKLRITFSGNQDRPNYDQELIQTRFNLLSRVRVFDQLSQSLSSTELSVLTNKTQLAECLKGNYQNKLVWLYWTWSPDCRENLDLRIPESEWFEFLASSDFFIATPGIRMPLCFNLIEAMYVGTIPIIEYPQYLDPPLEDGVNCIVFKGSDGLTAAVKKVLSMSLEEIDQLRNGVEAYVDNHLWPGAFVSKIEKLNNVTLNAYFNATNVSFELPKEK